MSNNTINYVKLELLYSQLLLNVSLLPCPLGFQLSGNPPGCECHPVLSEKNVKCQFINHTGYHIWNGPLWLDLDNISNLHLHLLTIATVVKKLLIFKTIQVPNMPSIELVDCVVAARVTTAWLLDLPTASTVPTATIWHSSLSLLLQDSVLWSLLVSSTSLSLRA